MAKTLESLVPQLDFCLQMKDGGLSQDTVLCWWHDNDDGKNKVELTEEANDILGLKGEGEILCAAPTIGEMWEFAEAQMKGVVKVVVHQSGDELTTHAKPGEELQVTMYETFECQTFVPEGEYYLVPKVGKEG